MTPSINLNDYKGIKVSKIVELTGLTNYYQSHPICIQKANLLRDAQLQGKLHLIK